MDVKNPSNPRHPLYKKRIRLDEDGFLRGKTGGTHRPDNPNPDATTPGMPLNDTWSSRLAAERGIPEHQLWKELRRELGLSLRDIADFIGISHNQVWKWELGLNYPNAADYAKLLEILEEAVTT